MTTRKTQIARRWRGSARLALTTAIGATLASVATAGEVKLTVALAANPQLQTAASLIDEFYKTHPGIKVEFQTLPEKQLRPAVLRDLSATPSYGSSSFMFYRNNLFQAAGLIVPEQPPWDQVADFAAKLKDDWNSVPGICLRGSPGWFQSLAPLTTVIHSFGGRWFDEDWQPQLSAPKSSEAINFHINALCEHGQPDAAFSNWPECMQLFSQGHAAMWYDDTVFAGPVLDQAPGGIKENIGFVLAPVKETEASGWLRAWGLAIPKSSRNLDAPWQQAVRDMDSGRAVQTQLSFS